MVHWSISCLDYKNRYIRVFNLLEAAILLHKSPAALCSLTNLDESYQHVHGDDMLSCSPNYYISGFSLVSDSLTVAYFIFYLH